MLTKLKVKDKFNKELPADPDQNNTRRQVHKACFSYATPRIPTAPQLLHVSPEMAETLGLSAEDTASEAFLQVFSGQKVLEGTAPYAMCYGGHQFGHWAGQLGDGRAINLMEVEQGGKTWALQLKGAGETPYSRTADGLAVLRSSVREHLCSEAMYHLGVPTTRSLSLMLTGDQVLRDVMYDGNSAYEKGAVVCRTAPSFIRFGNFQIFTSRKDKETLKALTDFTIRHYFPSLEAGTKAGYIEFFRTVCARTMEMVLHWQRVGFVHGVMNTDNLSILGLTIDYGPYGWLEGYDPNWTPNTTDRQNRRYRYGQQPNVALWNLAQLGSALMPLIEEVQPLQEILDNCQQQFPNDYLQMMSQKLGLKNMNPVAHELITDLVQQLQLTETDMTIFFRTLSQLRTTTDLADDTQLEPLVLPAIYLPEEYTEELKEKWRSWLLRYQAQLQQEQSNDTQRQTSMNVVNPKYVLRNYMAQLAIDAANAGDYTIINELYELLKTPYADNPEQEKWFAKRPEWARHKVGCSMLSCSS